jgi:hypothetical protein
MSAQDLSGTQVGDKVRIRTGEQSGERGIVAEVSASILVLRLEDGSEVALSSSSVTNFSLAARRAWEVMPKRAGRPVSTEARKQMVSLRIEIDLWQRLGKAVETGLVASREQAINQWIRDNLQRLESGQASQ